MRAYVHIATAAVTLILTTHARAEDPAAARLPDLTVSAVPEPDRNHLSGRAVVKVVRARKSSVTLCYERWLRKDRELGGRVSFLVTVTPDGRVAGAKIATKAFERSPVAECIQKTIVKWRFPPFAGNEPQDVLLPFNLSNRSPGCEGGIRSRRDC